MQKFSSKEVLNFKTAPPDGLAPTHLVDGETYTDISYKIHAIASTTFTTLNQAGEDWSGITLDAGDEVIGYFTDIEVNSGSLIVYPRP